MKKRTNAEKTLMRKKREMFSNKQTNEFNKRMADMETKAQELEKTEEHVHTEECNHE